MFKTYTFVKKKRFVSSLFGNLLMAVGNGDRCSTSIYFLGVKSEETPDVFFNLYSIFLLSKVAPNTRIKMILV